MRRQSQLYDGRKHHVDLIKSLANVPPSLVTAAAALFGALIGGGAAILTQLVAQIAIALRERRLRKRNEDAVRHLFGVRLEALQSIVVFGAEGIIRDDQITEEYKTLDALVSDTDRILALNKDQRKAVIEAVTALRINMRKAQQTIETFAVSESSTQEAHDQITQRLAATYKSGFEALNAALLTFGCEAVKPLDFGLTKNG